MQLRSLILFPFLVFGVEASRRLTAPSGKNNYDYVQSVLGKRK